MNLNSMQPGPRTDTSRGIVAQGTLEQAVPLDSQELLERQVPSLGYMSGLKPDNNMKAESNSWCHQIFLVAWALSFVGHQHAFTLLSDDIEHANGVYLGCSGATGATGRTGATGFTGSTGNNGTTSTP